MRRALIFEEANMHKTARDDTARRCYPEREGKEIPRTDIKKDVGVAYGTDNCGKCVGHIDRAVGAAGSGRQAESEARISS